MKETKGILFVISAPSGAGKSTLAAEILRTVPGIRYSVSFTTRPPRTGENHGEDYFFIAEAEFARRKDDGEFVESAFVHGYWYGTPKAVLEDHLRDGKDVLLDIDVQGGRQIKKIFSDAVLIFIMPPSLQVLEHRLRGRRKDPEETIQRRLEGAKREIEASGDYEYLIVNEEVQLAVEQMRAVIWAERRRMRRTRSQVLSRFQGTLPVS